MPRQLYARELRDGTALVLVTVDFAGRRFYLSERPVVVATTDGGALPFDGGLAGVDVSVALGLMGSDADLLSVPVACFLPVDLAALRAQGHQLSGAQAEVAVWVPGTLYEDRQVLVLGSVSEPTYGAQGEQVAFSVTEAPYDDTGRVIAPVEVIRWEDFEPVYGADGFGYYQADASEGAAFPWVFGRFGVCTVGGVLSSVPSVPAPAIALASTGEATFLLLCSGFAEASLLTVTDAYGNADEVTPNTVTGITIYDVESFYGVANSGTRFTRVGPLIAMTTVDLLASTLYVSASVTTPVSGGPSYDGSPTPARSWGEVVAMLLRRSSLRLDWGRWDAVLPLLQRYEVAGYIDDPDVSPWEFIAAEMLPLVPVSIRSGPRGLYPVIWRYDATHADAQGHINAGLGTGVVRSGPVEEFPQPSELVNSCSLSYAWNALTEEYTHWTTHGPLSTTVPAAPASTFTDETVSPPGATPAQDVTYSREVFAQWTTDLHTSAYSEASVRTFGTYSETIESKYVYDDATAQLITAWKVRAGCFPRRRIPYDVDSSWSWLDVGDVVTLTDSELSITSIPALVLEASVALGGRVSLVLLVLDDVIGGTNAAA